MTLVNWRGTQLVSFLMTLGHTGVVAFFVHTSLVLMFSLERTPERMRSITFYVRRMFRIYPLAVLCVVCVVPLRIPASPWFNDPFTASATIIASNLLLVQNLIGNFSISAPMWSLAYEVQMYAVLPLFFCVAKGRNAVARLLGIAAFFWCVGWMVQRITGHANMLAYLPCFLGGILAYALRNTRPVLSSVLWPPALAAWMVVTAYGVGAPILVKLPATWIASLLLGGGVFCFHGSTSRFWNKATAFVARYSYGIYLSHTPLIWLVFRVLRIHNDALATIIWLAATLGVSMLLFHAFESPMINLGRRLTDRWAVARAPRDCGGGRHRVCSCV
jgi:peptidoglycan/LPS O-acetylase OafA/YrhL